MKANGLDPKPKAGATWTISALRPGHAGNRRCGHTAHHGIAIVEEGIRYGADGDGMSFYICDPSGNQIELKSPIAD